MYVIVLCACCIMFCYMRCYMYALCAHVMCLMRVCACRPDCGPAAAISAGEESGCSCVSAHMMFGYVVGAICCVGCSNHRKLSVPNNETSMH